MHNENCSETLQRFVATAHYTGAQRKTLLLGWGGGSLWVGLNPDRVRSVISVNAKYVY